MKKRQFISQEYQLNQAKIPFAVTVIANNTTLTTIERYNGSWRYNGQKGEQIIYTITFKDLGYSITSKARDHHQIDNEWIYVKYALASMECTDTYEEYYKAALLIAKNRLKRGIQGYEKEKKKFEKTGYWSWPYNTDPKFYKRAYNLDKKALASIDIAEKDLSFFKSFSQSVN